MDQSGSRPDIRRPLIIERPDLAHPARRALALCFTALAWCAWLALWLPVLTSVAERFGIALPWAYRSGERSLQALQQLLDVFPVAIGTVLAVLAVNGIISWLYRRVRKPQPHRHIGIQQLANSMTLDERKLTAWQAARVLRVAHNPDGRVIDAHIVR
jgi:poly-beta-1,6-N-acetyl-D-glucosamine biosynthesis protein PgaD